jgi:hypothetical protein
MLDERFTSHLWAALRSVAWFDRLDAEGVIARFLASGDYAAETHVMDLVPTVAKQRADRLAELISPYAGRADHYLHWLAWVSRFANVYESRPLFELMVDAVRRGQYDGREGALWQVVYGLGQHQPAWAVELLAAWVVDRTGALDLSDEADDRLSILHETEHNLVELVPGGAEGAPTLYVELLVPYLLRVMSLTETDTTRRPIPDRHFFYRQMHPSPRPELGDSLIHGAATALRRCVQQDRSAVQSVLEELARDPHHAAQWLLYEALAAAGEEYADWTADLLLEGEERFYSGYLSDLFWTTRQLLQATTPYMSDEHFRQIETAVVGFNPPGESRQNAGASSFTLLSGMVEGRLSKAGRRRLGELRRRFNIEQPAAPTDLVGGLIRSPIPDAAAEHMTDDQWLSAMARYRTDQMDFERLTGGVHELAQALRIRATNDPARFARLALRLTSDTPSAYADAILQALGQTDKPVEPTLVFDVVRHIARFNRGENDQSLSMALRRQLDREVPDDIVGIVLDRALHAADPVEDMWSIQASNGQFYFGGDIFTNGINSARGQAAITLGDLIVNDTEGHLTQLVTPSLRQLAEDPSVAVRSCMAHVLAASLRHAGVEAIAAFKLLITADDRLLATRHVVNLMIHIGVGRTNVVEPVIQRMLASQYEGVRETGGLLAAYAGLEWGFANLLQATRESADAATRKGAADLCARRLPHTMDVAAATAALLQFINDEDDDVRQAAAQVAAMLRGYRLQPFASLLIALVESSSFRDALPQFLITLREAPGRIDDIVLHCTRRYIEVFADEAGNIATAAAGEAQEVSQLLLRGYEQASNREVRRQILDLIDGLLLINAVGVLEAVDQAERESTSYRNVGLSISR